MCSKSTNTVRAEMRHRHGDRVETLVPHRTFTGNRPTLSCYQAVTTIAPVR